jgi:hypothetical protein
MFSKNRASSSMTQNHILEAIRRFTQSLEGSLSPKNAVEHSGIR